MEDILGKKIMKELVGLRAKSCSYLMDHSSEDKKAKDAKTCFIKKTLKF